MLRMATDVDGVVSNLMADLITMRNADTPDSVITVNDIVTYDCSKLYGFESIDEMLEYICSHKLLENASLIKGSREALIMISNMGVEITAITARSYHPNSHSVTSEWFYGNNVPVDHVVISESNKEKAFNSLSGNFDIYIDDYIDNLIMAENSGKFGNIFLFDQPWNIGRDIPANWTRISDLSELMDYLPFNKKQSKKDEAA